MCVNLCLSWRDGVLTWYLTWTKLFYLKNNGHMAKSYWHRWITILKGQN